MKNKKIIAISLCAGLLLSSLGATFAGFGNIFKKPTPSKIDPIKVGAIEQNTGRNSAKAVSVSQTDNFVKNEGFSFSGERVVPKGKDPFSGDIYKLNREDLESFAKEGYSLKDIFRADSIGNSICVDPKELLKRSKEENKDLDVLQNEISAQKKKDLLNALGSKYPNEYKLINTMGLNESDMLSILAFVDDNDVSSIPALVDDYKKQGQQGLAKHLKKKQVVLKSGDIQNGISQEDIEGLSEKEFEQLKKISQKMGRPLGQLIREHKEIVKKLNAEGE